MLARTKPCLAAGLLALGWGVPAFAQADPPVESRPLPVEILDVSPARATAWLVGRSTLSLKLAVREKEGAALTLKPPRVTSLTVQGPGETRYQAPFRLDYLVDGEADGEISLEGHGTREIELRFLDLEGAGRYQGKVRLEAPGYKGVDHSIALYLKEPYWVALGCILIGILVSSVMRLYGASWRPRLVSQRRALLLREEIEAEAASEETTGPAAEVFALLRRWLHALLLELETGQANDPQATLDLLEKKLELSLAWRSVSQRVAALQPESLRSDFRSLLDTAERILRRDVAGADEIAESLRSLQEAPAKISERIRRELESGIDKLGQELADLRADPGCRVMPALLESVEQSRQKARKLLQEDDDLENALKAFGEARRRYTEVLLDDLEQRLEKPPGFHSDQWEPLRQRVRRQAEVARDALARDPEQASAAYHDAYTLFLRGATEALLSTIEDEEGRLPNREITREQQEAARGKLSDLKAGLGQAQQEILSGDLAAGHSTYDQAVADFLRVRREIQPPAHRSLSFSVEAEAEASSSPAASAAAFSAVADRGSKAPLPKLPTLAAVERTLGWSDFLVALAIFLLAGLMGLHTLWNADPAWGGWSSRFLALLWGLGLHQATFDGMSGLSDKLLGNKS